MRQNTSLMESLNLRPVESIYTVEDMFSLSFAMEGDTKEQQDLRQMVENYKRGDRSVSLNQICGLMEAVLFPGKATKDTEKPLNESKGPNAGVNTTQAKESQTKTKLDPFKVGTSILEQRQLENLGQLNESKFAGIRSTCKGKTFLRRLAEFQGISEIPESSRMTFSKAITSAYTHMLIEAEQNKAFEQTLKLVTPIFESHMFVAIRSGKVSPALSKVIGFMVKEG